MKTNSIVIVVLIILIAAPSAMADAPQEPPETWRAFAQKLEAGAFVQVRLKDGTKVKGAFIPSSEDIFRLQPKTRIPVPIRNFQFSEIQSIERQRKGWSPGRKVLTFTAAGVGATLAVFIIAIAGISD